MKSKMGWMAAIFSPKCQKDGLCFPIPKSINQEDFMNDRIQRLAAIARKDDLNPEPVSIELDEFDEKLAEKSRSWAARRPDCATTSAPRRSNCTMRMSLSA